MRGGGATACRVCPAEQVLNPIMGRGTFLKRRTNMQTCVQEEPKLCSYMQNCVKEEPKLCTYMQNCVKEEPKLCTYMQTCVQEELHVYAERGTIHFLSGQPTC